MHTIIAVENLTPIQQALIAAAAVNRGSMQVQMRVEMHGRAIVAGKTVFADPADRTVAERHLAAVPELQELQLLRAGGGRGRYELTNIGWEMSRKLRNTEQQPCS